MHAPIPPSSCRNAGCEIAIAFSPPRPLIRLTVAASSVATQSHRILPPSVRTNSARCPIAKPAPIPMRPVSYSWKLFMWLCASAASVVQLCPRAGTYCRSSSQIMHCAGGCALSGYCMPQAVQMKRGIEISSRHSGPRAKRVDPESRRTLRYSFLDSGFRPRAGPGMTDDRTRAHCVGSCGFCKRRPTDNSTTIRCAGA